MTSSLFPRNPNAREFDESSVDEFVNMNKTTLPPARDYIRELLDDPETMKILEELTETARKTRGSARDILENLDKIRKVRRDNPYWHVNK